MQKLKRTLYADVWRIYGKANLLLVVKAFLTKITFRPILTYRICNALNCQSNQIKKTILPIAKLFHHLFCMNASICLPISTKIGPGLHIIHGFCLVINGDAVIGNNSTFLHQVTIGGTKKGTPKLGDNVTFAAGTMAIGPVVVGSDSTIGAGALVIKDVESRSLVVGNPQVVIRTNQMPRTPNPAPDYLLV